MVRTIKSSRGTAELLDRMPETVLRQLRDYKVEYSEADRQLNAYVRRVMRAYTHGLCDAGLVTEQESRMLFSYMTIARD